MYSEELGQGIKLFTISWNNEGVLAIGSTMSEVILKQFDPKTNKFSDMGKVSCANAVRSIEFNPLKNDILAIGMFNGAV